jgi:hypothetical protein
MRTRVDNAVIAESVGDTDSIRRHHCVTDFTRSHPADFTGFVSCSHAT